MPMSETTNPSLRRGHRLALTASHIVSFIALPATALSACSRTTRDIASTMFMQMSFRDNCTIQHVLEISIGLGCFGRPATRSNCFSRCVRAAEPHLVLSQEHTCAFLEEKHDSQICSSKLLNCFNIAGLVLQVQIPKDPVSRWEGDSSPHGRDKESSHLSLHKQTGRTTDDDAGRGDPGSWSPLQQS